MNQFDKIKEIKKEISNIEQLSFFKRLKLLSKKKKLNEEYENLYNLLQENAKLNSDDFAHNIAEVLTKNSDDKNYFVTDFIFENNDRAFFVVAPFDTTYFLRNNYYMLEKINKIEDITSHISNDDFIVITFAMPPSKSTINVLNEDCNIKEEYILKHPELENYIKNLVINNINNVPNYNYINEYVKRIRQVSFKPKKKISYMDAMDEELEYMGDDPHYCGKHHSDAVMTLLEYSLLKQVDKLYKDLEENRKMINRNKY